MNNIDLNVVDAEYGQDEDPCSFCGGTEGHRILTREDGSATRCQVGDVRALARALRELRENWSTALDELKSMIPTKCRHGRDIYGTCAVCDDTDPLNVALTEAEDFIGLLARGSTTTAQQATEMLEVIRQYRDGEM